MYAYTSFLIFLVGFYPIHMCRAQGAQISDSTWRHRTPIRTLNTTFLFAWSGAWLSRWLLLQNKRETQLKHLKETTMKLSIIRSACGSLRVNQARPGGRVSGLSRRCPPISAANGRVIVRTTSATSSSGTSPKLSVNFGKQYLKEDGLDSCLR